MANKTLFQAIRGLMAPKADTRNEAGGLAYALTPEHALAIYASTGCLNGTFYASAATQLDRVLGLAAAVDARFVAQTAIYVRQRGGMKDLPALLLATLTTRDLALFEASFARVIDTPKMLRNFVQIMRSG